MEALQQISTMILVKKKKPFGCDNKLIQQNLKSLHII